MPSVFAGVGMWVESQQEEVAPGQTLEKTVEEFAFATGVGVDFYLSHHLAIRPDVRLMFINLSTDTHMVPIFGVHVTYHFDSHPYLPRR
jgi:outer membrane protein W